MDRPNGHCNDASKWAKYARELEAELSRCHELMDALLAAHKVITEASQQTHADLNNSVADAFDAYRKAIDALAAHRGKGD